MYAAISECKELFIKYGGHRMAAGLSLPEENVSLFRQYLNEHCQLREADFESKVLIDVPLPLSQMTEQLIGELKLLEPFGMGNSKPVFAQKDICVRRAFLLGKNKNVIRFQAMDEGGKFMEMVYFGDTAELKEFLIRRFGSKGDDIFYKETEGVQFSATYYPLIQEYRGKRTLQIVMTNYC